MTSRPAHHLEHVFDVYQNVFDIYLQLYGGETVGTIFPCGPIPALARESTDSVVIVTLTARVWKAAVLAPSLVPSLVHEQGALIVRAVNNIVFDI